MVEGGGRHLPFPTIRQVEVPPGHRPEFELVMPFKLSLNLGRAQYTFRVPAGFRTDFATVPRALWWWLHPLDTDVAVAALVHDDLYGAESECPRFLADSFLRAIMDMYGAGLLRQLVVFYMVRLFGWLSFRRET